MLKQTSPGTPSLFTSYRVSLDRGWWRRTCRGEPWRRARRSKFGDGKSIFDLLFYYR